MSCNVTPLYHPHLLLLTHTPATADIEVVVGGGATRFPSPAQPHLLLLTHTSGLLPLTTSLGAPPKPLALLTILVVY